MWPNEFFLPNLVKRELRAYIVDWNMLLQIM